MSCTATNTEGSDNANVVIDVACRIVIFIFFIIFIFVMITFITDAPEIVEEPKTVRARAGEEVSFKCKVSLTRTMMYTT